MPFEIEWSEKDAYNFGLPGGHDVRVVDNLEEWRHLDGVLQLLLAHTDCNLLGSLLQTSNEGVTIRASTITLQNRQCVYS